MINIVLFILSLLYQVDRIEDVSNGNKIAVVMNANLDQWDCPLTSLPKNITEGSILTELPQDCKEVK